MTIAEIYPFFNKVQSSLLTVLEYLTPTELSTIVAPYDTSVSSRFDALFDFYNTWLFQPLSFNAGSSLSLDNSTFSDHAAQLTDIFKNLDLCLESSVNLDSIYTIVYYRGSVEVEGKFSLRYLLWSIVEYTIHTRAEIYMLLKTMNIAVPELLQ